MLTIYQNENVNAVSTELDIYKFKNEIDTLKKEFEENISKLTNIAQSKNIILIKNSLEEAQRALNNVTSQWYNFLSLIISKSKVNSVDNTVKSIYEIAYEKLMEYNRDVMWGTTCY
ncbi:hypothetical protein KQ874_01470 [Mycoplasma sp. ES3157-GEN-MYC]|uniref:Uncharacterized protein n=1 Tax=Mycoplasma miroungigenitalium TaxID=754515 RepID=A0A6M4JBI1_9MOLU|nr:hypothetical protein [Mycoplasma miroungigenitalium]MBU4690357.1 hypothetical protein [Mycoplasma miroungigenitalium]MBU4691624.1 hypothetical protein [Mycoplasma miroungigenitalium]QJR43449.1 hypothetical protein HLA87_01455 [Mycoplasma miroungigenitalium]